MFQELCVGSGRALEEEMAPECGQFGVVSGTEAGQMADSGGQVSKETGIKRLLETERVMPDFCKSSSCQLLD